MILLLLLKILLLIFLQVNSVSKISSNIFDIQVSTDAITFFVWLSTQNIKGHFSDNGFLLITPSTNIHFYAHEDVTVDQLSSHLKVISVSDVILSPDDTVIGWATTHKQYIKILVKNIISKFTKRQICVPKNKESFISSWDNSIQQGF